MNYIESQTFFFVDCFAIAMMVNIRDKSIYIYLIKQVLYNSSPSKGLQMLLNYPNKSDYLFILSSAYNI